MLDSDIIPVDAAEALLVVIPKELVPTSMRSFRPLSFCNVPIKVLCKVIVNRLKSLLQDVIMPNQTSFIPGQQIMDNIMTCQEVVHSLKYTQAMHGGMIMMLDLEKAYGRLKWSFVEEALHVFIPISQCCHEYASDQFLSTSLER